MHVTNINTGDVAATTLVQRLMNDCMDASAAVMEQKRDASLLVRWVDSNSYAWEWNAAVDVASSGSARVVVIPAGTPRPAIEAKLFAAVAECEREKTMAQRAGVDRRAASGR